MKTQLLINSNYGFDHNWSLLVTTKKVTKTFFLGQDVKFCTRVLGMEPSYVIADSGVRDLTNEKNRNKLAKYIATKLGITSKNMLKIESWRFCAQ